jgi:hypothetical protein
MRLQKVLRRRSICAISAERHVDALVPRSYAQRSFRCGRLELSIQPARVVEDHLEEQGARQLGNRVPTCARP